MSRKARKMQEQVDREREATQPNHPRCPYCGDPVAPTERDNHIAMWHPHD